MREWAVLQSSSQAHLQSLAAIGLDVGQYTIQRAPHQTADCTDKVSVNLKTKYRPLYRILKLHNLLVAVQSFALNNDGSLYCARSRASGRSKAVSIQSESENHMYKAHYHYKQIRFDIWQARVTELTLIARRGKEIVVMAKSRVDCLDRQAHRKDVCWCPHLQDKLCRSAHCRV